MNLIVMALEVFKLLKALSVVVVVVAPDWRTTFFRHVTLEHPPLIIPANKNFTTTYQVHCKFLPVAGYIAVILKSG